MTVDHSDLQCPDCNSPLASLSRLASQYDDHHHELIYASRCPNGGCSTDQVDPTDIRSQLEAATSDGLGPLAKLSQSVATLRQSLSFNFTLDIEIDRSQVLMVAIIGVLLTGVFLAVTGLLPAPLGSSSSGTASAYANLTRVSDPALDTYNETGNWTIYEYNGQFVVTGKLNDTVVYLNPDGNVTQVPYFYDLRPDARKAILAWNSKHGESPTKYPEPDAPLSSELNKMQTSDWSIFKHNESYVVGGEINGSVVYLYPNGTYRDDPFFYENNTDAKGAILIWEAHQDQFPEILPSVDPVTTDEVQLDLEDWESNRPSRSSDTDSSDWNWDHHDNPVDKADPSEQQASYAVRGKVTNSEGDAVEGATVHFHSNPRTTTTGPNGSYTFENVTPGNHTLYVDPPANTSLAATEPVNLTMSESGDLRVHGSPDHVSFLAATDGTVSENSLQLWTRPEQPISARGKGSAMQTVLQFAQPLNADNTTVSLTGLYTESQQTRSIEGTETDKTISITGNQQPSDPTLFLSGRTNSRQFSETGTYTGTDPTVTFHGNQQPTNVSVHLNRSSSESSGRDQFKTQHSYAGDSVYDSVSIGGNLRPTNQQATIAARKWFDGGTGKYRSNILCERHYNDWSGTYTYDQKEESGQKDVWTADSDGTYRLTVDYKFKAYVGSCGFYTFEGEASGKITANGVKFASGDVTSWDEWGERQHKKAGTVTKTVELKEGDSVVLDYDMRGGATVKTNVEAEKLANDPENVKLRLNGDDYEISGLERGGEKTIPVESLQAGQNSIETTSETGSASLQVDLSWTERVGTENPTVQIAGRTVCQKDGVLTEAMVCDVPSTAVSPGEQTVDLQTDRGPVNYTVAYEGRAKPRQAEVEIGDTVYEYPTDFTTTGPVPERTEPAELNITSLSLGETSVAVDTEPVDGIETSVNATVVYDGERRQTKRPTVVVESASGATYEKAVPDSALSGTGTLDGTYTLSVPAEWFASGENVVRVKTADESLVRARVNASGLYSQYRTFNRTVSPTN